MCWCPSDLCSAAWQSFEQALSIAAMASHFPLECSRDMHRSSRQTQWLQRCPGQLQFRSHLFKVRCSRCFVVPATFYESQLCFHVHCREMLSLSNASKQTVLVYSSCNCASMDILDTGKEYQYFQMTIKTATTYSLYVILAENDQNVL